MRLYLVRPWQRFGMAAAAVTQSRQPVSTRALSLCTAAAAVVETQPERAEHPCSAATAALLVRTGQAEPSRAVVGALQREHPALAVRAARS
jgi:hypothetical protein